MFSPLHLFLLSRYRRARCFVHRKTQCAILALREDCIAGVFTVGLKRLHVGDKVVCIEDVIIVIHAIGALFFRPVFFH